MTASLIAIQMRREILVAEAAAQRALLAEAWRGFDKPVAAANRVAKTLRSPWLWAGLGLVAFKLPKKRLMRVPVLIWKGWRMLRRVRAILG
jgi:hypothetical protein